MNIQAVKSVVDATFAGGAVAAYAGWIPPFVTVIVGVFAILWYISRLLEWIVPHRVNHVRKILDRKEDDERSSNSH